MCLFFFFLMPAGINAKKEESNAAFLFFAFWVEGGTRTHDIQNHNLTL